VRQPLVLTGGDVLTGDEIVANGVVVLEDGVITAIGAAGSVSGPAGALEIDGSGVLICPGLIDIQINGGFGHDFTHESGSIWEVGAKLPQFGVTSFLPTVVTSGSDARRSMMDTLAAGPPEGYAGAIPLGSHFEGPFISPDASGAHDPAFLRVPSQADSDVGTWSKDSGVRIVTLAPELDGALELIASLVARHVLVSAGHSQASRDQAAAAFDAGATYVTHLFNAMSPLDHRQPGLPGAALVDPRVTVGLIADGIHVHPDVIRVAANAAGPGRVSLVTDATAALGMAPGRYMLGGRDVVLDGTSVRLADDSRLAGSALTADEALRHFTEMSGWPAGPTIAAMTSAPARLLKLHDRGVVRVGARADLVLLTHDLEVKATFIGGERWA
jgi:N-acetylglucosamine-6-phosphate deacetylase